jgi:hypothetical protein
MELGMNYHLLITVCLVAVGTLAACESKQRAAPAPKVKAASAQKMPKAAAEVKQDAAKKAKPKPRPERLVLAAKRPATQQEVARLRPEITQRVAPFQWGEITSTNALKGDFNSQFGFSGVMIRTTARKTSGNKTIVMRSATESGAPRPANVGFWSKNGVYSGLDDFKGRLGAAAVRLSKPDAAAQPVGYGIVSLFYLGKQHLYEYDRAWTITVYEHKADAE